jgi:hypothetical protein
MTIKPYLLPILLCGSLAAQAESKPHGVKHLKEKPALASSMLSHLSINALASYTDFTFDSESGTNYNIVFSPTLAGGISLFKSQTNLGSYVNLAPGLPSVITQTTRSDIIFGHVMKAYKYDILFDLAAAYSWNRVDTTSVTAPGKSAQLGYSANNGDNWFLSVSALHSKAWKQFIVSTNARLLYSQVETGSYLFYSTTSTATPQTVQPLTNQSWYLMENLELGYKLQRYPQWMPFANTGLVQVLSYHNSRPSIGIAIAGSAPQLDLNKNGVHFGTGFNYTHKQFSLRLEQQYYSAGRTYYSLQTLLGLSYALS